MDVAYGKEFEISYEEQSVFAQNAITKFSNLLIEDSIQRNSRDALRKLASEERLFGTLKIMRKQGVDYSLVIETIALAIYYAIKVENKTLNDFSYISSLVSKEESMIINERVEQYVAR
jgi:mannitol-1-phosphate 5-dehydrogenase